MKEREPKLISAGKFTSRGAWIHPRRRIDSSELIVVLEGSFAIMEEGRTYPLSRGSVLILEEGLEHSGVELASGTVSFYWIHLRGLGAPAELGLKKHTVLSNPYALQLLCRQLLFYSNPPYQIEVAEHLLQVVLAELRAQGGEESLLPAHPVVRVREWIRINSDRPLTAQLVAQHFGYHEDYLSRLLKKDCGKGLKGVIDEMKLLQIKQLLQDSELSLYEIAQKTQFDDYKLFLKFFKYHEGITPTEYRKLYCDIHTNNR